jgi:hypothetical protein
MKKKLLCLLLLSTVTTIFCKYQKLDYEQNYAYAASSKNPLPLRLTEIRNILRHAKDTDFLRKKKLRKLRWRLKSLLVKLSKQIRKLKPGQPIPGEPSKDLTDYIIKNLTKRYLQLIAMTYNTDTLAYKHIGRLHPKDMERCILRIFANDIKEFKKEHRKLLLIQEASTNRLPKKANKMQAKLKTLNEKKDKIIREKSASPATKLRLNRVRKKIENTQRWLTAYKDFESRSVTTQGNLTQKKSNIRRKAVAFARSAGPEIATVLNKKFQEIAKKRKFTIREKLKLRRLRTGFIKSLIS